MNLQCLIFIALGFIAAFALLFYLMTSRKSD
jgi:hypothetical protein